MAAGHVASLDLPHFLPHGFMELFTVVVFVLIVIVSPPTSMTCLVVIKHRQCTFAMLPPSQEANGEVTDNVDGALVVLDL